MKDIKIQKDSLPIIFIHYGDSDYLKYTFLSALKTNPTKDIILIGDAENKHYSKIGVKHFLYEEYADSDELRLFNTVY